jgi:DNA adenine methylase
MTAPIIKWAGGKTKLLADLVKRMPPTFKTYYEPFFGGGALFFHRLPEKAILSDINHDLFALYLAVRDHVELVISDLSILERRHSKRCFNETKAEWNHPADRSRWDLWRRAAYFIYLNRTCFNGLWRVNQSGEFNVPMGDYPKGHTICDAHKLRAAARALATAKIQVGHYSSNISSARHGDFVYFDPPYDPVSKTANFTAYTSSRFDDTEQWNLALRAKELVDAGVYVMLSNSDTHYIRKTYRGFGFKIHRVSAPRSINSKGSKRGNVGELIITGGY